MDRALKLAVTMTLMDLPWFILCVLPFMPMRKIEVKTMAQRILIVASISFVILFLSGLILNRQNMVLINLFHYLTYFPMLLIFYHSFNVGWSKIFFVFLFEQAIASEVNLLAYHVTSSIFQQFPSVMNGFWLLLSVYLILVVVFPLSWLSLRGPIRQAMVTLTDKQARVLCITPLLFFLTTTAYSLLLGVIKLSDVQEVIFSLFVSFIGISAYAVNLITTNDIVKKSQLELEVITMEQQLARQSDRFKQLQELNAQSRQARHDLRHHLTVIRTYLDNKDYQKLEDYLEEYLSHLPKDREQQICQNFAVDVLLRDYLAKAQEAGAIIDVNIDLPEKCGIPDTQLCIVFGNLVENALNACRMQQNANKFIHIRCRTEGKQILASFNNSTEGKMPVRAGVGLSSIQEVVKRYQGTFLYEIENDVFQASLLLNIP